MKGDIIMTKNAQKNRELLIQKHNEKFSQITQQERNEAAARVEAFFEGTDPTSPLKITEKELIKQ